MAKRKRKSEDINEGAFRVVRESTFEAIPITAVKKRKNPAAVALGRLGGKKGGRARANKECIGCRPIAISGNPKAKDISTSYVERQNLTMRMQMRRFTRLTNAFSKKVENHGHAVALHYMHYNFCRVHQTLRVTPAMEAGIAEPVWSLEEVVFLLDRSASIAA